MPQRFGWVAAGLVVAVLAGCATQERSASVYSAREAQREQTVRMAVVEAVREVTIDRGRTGVGTAGGAAVGGIAGSTIGHGRGSVAGAVLGAVAGGVIGQSMEGSASKVKGVEITLRLDNGDVRAIVQEADNQQFLPGDRVRILSSGGVSRVSR
jgi:outer membrane lipoprotein SlyB